MIGIGYSGDEIMLASLIAGEAADQPIEGQIAVAWSVRNRVHKPRWWGETWIEVMSYNWQYEAVWRNRMQLWKLWERVTEKELWVARGVIAGWLPDPTGGATHYYAPALVKEPKWAKKLPLTVVIEDHRFYVEA